MTKREEEQQQPPPAEPEPGNDEVDEASQESFPASDAPAWIGKSGKKKKDKKAA